MSSRTSGSLLSVFTVAFGGDAVFQELIDHAVATHRAAAAVLQFQVRGGHAPAVVLATDQVK